MLQIERYLVDRHIDTVGTGCDQSCCLISLVIQYGGKISGRSSVNIMDVRGGIHNALVHTISGTAANHGESDQTHQKCFRKYDGKLFTNHGTLGKKLFFFLCSTFSSIIHK